MYGHELADHKVRCIAGALVPQATQSCTPCQPGHYRNTRMSTCAPCPENTFAALPRAGYCEQCPYWADCVEADRVPVRGSHSTGRCFAGYPITSLYNMIKTFQLSYRITSLQLYL